MNQSNSDNNKQIIADLDNKVDDEIVPRSPGIDWKWFASLAALILVIAFLSSVLIFGGSLAKIANDNTELSTCRARYVAAVTDAQVSAEIVEYALFSSLNPVTQATQEQIDALVDELKVLGTELDKARDERLLYEQELTIPCPLGPFLIDE